MTTNTAHYYCEINKLGDVITSAVGFKRTDAIRAYNIIKSGQHEQDAESWLDTGHGTEKILSDSAK